jgi:hypothetical protein
VSARRDLTGGIAGRPATASTDAPARNAQLGSFDRRPSRPSHFPTRSVNRGQGAPAGRPFDWRRGSVTAP